MKKVYTLALAIGAFSLSVNAQVELTDNFDSYNLGKISSQADHWRTWSGGEGGPEDADVTDDEALSGDQSLSIGGNTITDMILLVPSAPVSGVYSISYSAFIPTGSSGYFNMQAALTPPGTAWGQALMGGNIHFNCSGDTPGVGMIDQSTVDDPPCSVAGATFSYPEEVWFRVDCVYDLDNQTWSLFIDGSASGISNYPFAFNTQVFIELAGLDFYSASSNNNMYIDDVSLYKGDILATNDFSENKFSVYPNPVKDILNIKSAASVDNVTIYDILGKVVLNQNPGTISPAVNMSSLAPGSYMVQVTIGNSSKTVKVLK